MKKPKEIYFAVFKQTIHMCLGKLTNPKSKSKVQVQVWADDWVFIKIRFSNHAPVEIRISLRFDKKYFGIIQGFQRQRSMIYYLQVDDDLLTFSYFHFLYI